MELKSFETWANEKQNEAIEVMRDGREFESRKLGNIDLVVLVDNKPTKVKEIIETGNEFIVIDSKNNVHKTKNVVSQMPYLEKIAKEMEKVFSTKLYDIKVSPGNGITFNPYREVFSSDAIGEQFFKEIEKTRKIAKKYNMTDTSVTIVPIYELDV